MMLWIGIGAYITKPIFWRAPISVKGCNWNLTLGPDAIVHAPTNISSDYSSIVNATTTAATYTERYAIISERYLFKMLSYNLILQAYFKVSCLVTCHS